MNNLIVAPGFIEALHKIKSCEIKTNELDLALYATDASLYQVKPIAIAIPASEDDLIHIVRLANDFKVPLLPRGSATSLAGQTTNQALIIDFTKYFNQILDINVEQKYAVVHPGVVRDQLNAAVKPFGLHFAPDPATSSRATIGGMIANNSSGTKSLKYGKTIDHIISLKVLLSSGQVLTLQNLTQEGWDKKGLLDNEEGKIYRQFRQLIFQHSEAIEAAYPKVLRRVQGYPLDEFINTDNWNLAKIFSGSEGSLGFILEATINLEPIPKHRAAFTLHYRDRLTAIREVKNMVAFDPVAIEMLDYHVFEKSIKNNMLKSIHQKIIVGEPKATLSVEFFTLNEEELEQKIQHFSTWISKESSAYACPILRSESDLEDSWSLRKNGLGLIMGDPNGRKPIPFIEDMAIPLENLADYIEQILDLCKRKGVETILYAHASVGVIHVRPSLDMTKKEDIVIMKEMSDEVFHLVKKYNGSWSGEHGDGRNRGHRLKDFFGDEVYDCLKEVKKLFDPINIMNPGIIIDVPPMDHHLRYGSQYSDKPQNFVFKYRNDHSFETLVHDCSGVGACRNHIGGTMCPSFKATSEEENSTRGRANALRMAISGQMGFTSLTDPKVLQVLDLCLSCKACKSECPSNVDMAKLKSEVWQKKYDKGKITSREKMIRNSHQMAITFSGWKASFVNKVQHSFIFKWFAEKIWKIDKRRTLPDFTSESLESWYLQNYKNIVSSNTIVLFADTYINYHEPQVGKASINLLNGLGYNVELASVGCCQRPRISNGFLKDAKQDGTKMAEKLIPFIKRGLKVVVCEPSCSSALLDDLPDLIDNESIAQSLKDNIIPLEIFVHEVLKNNQNIVLKSKGNVLLLHGHCHQKSSFGTQVLHDIYNKIPGVTIHEPDSGCCGMAGSFGYEKEHYDVSKKISELVLIPEIKKATEDTLIIANGFSCRHQIKDFANKKSIHWVESIEVDC
ncbi:MAG: FAD-linked oxidase C-terminal domain-containing protein [Saprospiraceae bacterium]